MILRRELDALLSLQRFVAGALPAPWDVRTDLEEGEDPKRPFALVEQAGGAETDGAPAVQLVTIPYTINLYLPKAATREAAREAALEVREVLWQAVKWGADRRTTDRIPLYSYLPRIETHRIRVANATHGTFTVTIEEQTTAPIGATATAEDVAAAIAAALGLDPAEVVGQDRGVGLSDVAFVGSLAGQRIGDPTADGTDLVGSFATASASCLLQGAAPPWRGPSDFMRVEDFSQNTVADPDDPKLVMVAADLRLTFVRGRPLPLETRILQRVVSDRG